MPSGIQVFSAKGELLLDYTSRKVEFAFSVTAAAPSQGSTYIDFKIDGVAPATHYIFCEQELIGNEPTGARAYLGLTPTVIDVNTVRLSTARFINQGTNFTFHVYRYA